MKRAYPALLAAVAFSVMSFGFLVAKPALAASSLEPGMRYCPAPWCDNSEFIDTHFGIDAKTGKLTKYSGTVHPDETGGAGGPGEVVLYSAPAPDVQNRYVPPAGAAPAPAYPAPSARQARPVYAAPLATPAQPQARVAAPSVAPSRAAPARPAANAAVRPNRGKQAEVAVAQAGKAKQPAGPVAGDRQGKKKLPWWKGIFKK